MVLCIWTSFSSYTVDYTEMRKLINSVFKMRNDYVRIDPHSNRELTSHYLQYALYSFLLTMKKVFMLSLFYTQC